jgi:hypothetical protein
VPIEVAADMRLALEEILANLIAYAWPDGDQHEAKLHLQVANGELSRRNRSEPGAFGRNFQVGWEAAIQIH